jgi:hypothetical protein
MEGEQRTNVVEFPPLVNATRQQLSHYLAEAAFLDWVCEMGGMTADQASTERARVLRHIGMVKFPPEEY